MRSIEQIAALLEVQARALINTFRHSEGRGGWKVSLTIAVLWYGFWIATAAGCAALPTLVGTEDVEAVLPGALLFIFAYWQLAPLLTLSLGVSLDVRKTIIYPVSPPALFAVECLLRLGTGIEMMLLLAGFLGGLAWAGSPHLGGLAAAFGLFVAFNVFLSAGVRNLVERVFHQRRLREVLLILLVCATLLPQVLIWSETIRGIGKAAWSALKQFPVWVLPSDPAAKLATGQGRTEDLWVLLGMVAAAGFFGYFQFRQGYSVAAAPSAGSRGSHLSSSEARRRFVGQVTSFPSRFLPDPIGALVEKELKYLWRSPRFRLPFFMGFTFGVIAWLPIIAQWRGGWGDWMEHSAVTLISLYSFLLLGPVMFLNRFGFDRGAARFYFWLPITLKELLLAKNLSTLVFAAFEVALIAIVCRMVGVSVGAVEIVETLVVSLIALLYLLSVGNYMSVRFPAASNPDRISRSGPGHGLRATVQFLLFPIALAPVAAAFIIRYGAGSATGFVILLAVGGGLGLALYLVSLSRLARYGEVERERLIAQLSGGEGPLATE